MGLLEKASKRSAELAGQMDGNQALTQKKKLRFFHILN